MIALSLLLTCAILANGQVTSHHDDTCKPGNLATSKNQDDIMDKIRQLEDNLMAKMRQLDDKVHTILVKVSECESDWIKIVNGCYFVPVEQHTWMQARNYCRALSGSHLAVFESREEMETVIQAFPLILIHHS